MSVSASSAALLCIDGIGKSFGGVAALSDISFRITPATVMGLIGPNGSGKTTLLNVINGAVAADGGEIRLGGIVITGKRPSALAAAGLSRTFQNVRVFRTLTVLQNLLVPLLHRAKQERCDAFQRAEELVGFVGLKSQATQIASTLSGGQQRLLEFARALVTRPRLILMDEPFAGVHPAIKTTLVGCIRETVEREGASFLIVSHEVPELVRMADSMVCLVEGKIAANGTPNDVVRDAKVIEGYLGRG